MKTPRITVVGSFNTDLMVRTARLPVAGETILGGPFRTGPGGKGANQAVAAARLGASVRMVVKLGLDYFGDQAYENLAKEGVDVAYVLRTDATHTGAAFILVDEQGENLIVVASGANELLSPEDVDAASAAIRDADVVLVQLEVPLETVERTAQLAHEAGVRVVLNPAPGRRLPLALLRLVDVLTPNETEARIICGAGVETGIERQEMARRLRDRGAQTIVMTLGAEGALLANAGGIERISGFSTEAVDTTGAGDSFNGALAVALAEGRALEEAVAFANAAASLQVTRVGTAPAMPYRLEVEHRLLDR